MIPNSIFSSLGPATPRRGIEHCVARVTVSTLKDAEMHKVGLNEMPDPEGEVREVSIETLLLGELPK